MTTMTDPGILPGTVNGHQVGIIMKEVVRRAIASISRNRMAFEATEKQGYKKAQDFVTTADKAAQQIYLKKLAECFPTFGIIAEEDDLRIDCSEPGADLYFTVDPLDGTKAFIRRQSHGIGTMVSLVEDGVVIAACVGDVMTREIYYFRPGSDKVHRFSWDDELHEVLAIKAGELRNEYASLGDDPRSMSEQIEWLTSPRRPDKVFKDIDIMGGSIGTRAARLWKGEIGALILKGGKCTPWDWCPIAGIGAKLGFWHLKVRGDEIEACGLKPIKTVEDWDFESIVIHQSRAEQLIRAAGAARSAR